MGKYRKYCCICSNYRGKLIDNRRVTLHRFPWNEQKANSWRRRIIQAMKGHVTLSKSSLVCSEHFHGFSGPRPGANIPSIFTSISLAKAAFPVRIVPVSCTSTRGSTSFPARIVPVSHPWTTVSAKHLNGVSSPLTNGLTHSGTEEHFPGRILPVTRHWPGSAEHLNDVPFSSTNGLTHCEGVQRSSRQAGVPLIVGVETFQVWPSVYTDGQIEEQSDPESVAFAEDTAQDCGVSFIPEDCQPVNSLLLHDYCGSVDRDTLPSRLFACTQTALAYTSTVGCQTDSVADCTFLHTVKSEP